MSWRGVDDLCDDSDPIVVSLRLLCRRTKDNSGYCEAKTSNDKVGMTLFSETFYVSYRYHCSILAYYVYIAELLCCGLFQRYVSL